MPDWVQIPAAGAALVVYVLLLVLLFIAGVMYLAAPFVLYSIHGRLVEIRDLLRAGAIAQPRSRAATAAVNRPARDQEIEAPRLILPSERIGYGAQRILVIGAAVVGLGVLIMIGWAVTR
jgi:hypothetical protein